MEGTRTGNGPCRNLVFQRTVLGGFCFFVGVYRFLVALSPGPEISAFDLDRCRALCVRCGFPSFHEDLLHMVGGNRILVHKRIPNQDSYPCVRTKNGFPRRLAVSFWEVKGGHLGCVILGVLSGVVNPLIFEVPSRKEKSCTGGFFF